MPVSVGPAGWRAAAKWERAVEVGDSDDHEETFVSGVGTGGIGQCGERDRDVHSKVPESGDGKEGAVLERDGPFLRP